MKEKYLRLIKPVLIGIAAILLLVNPEEALIALTSYLGAIAIFYGAISIASRYFSDNKALMFTGGYFEGLVTILLGIIILSHPENIIKLIIVLFGIIILFISLGQFSLYRKLEQVKQTSYFLLASAILSLGIALLLLFNPFDSARVISILIGSYLLFYSISSLVRSMTSWNKR